MKDLVVCLKMAAFGIGAVAFVILMFAMMDLGLAWSEHLVKGLMP